MDNGAGVLPQASADTQGELAMEVTRDGQGVHGAVSASGVVPAGQVVPAGELAPSTDSPRAAAPIEERAGASLQERVRNANLDFLHRVNDAMSLPIQVLIEQRDAVLAELSQQEQRAVAEQQRLAAEHERFVSYLMEEQLANLRHLREQLDASKVELQRAKALALQSPSRVEARPTALEVPERAAGAEPEASASGAAFATGPAGAGELEAALHQVDALRRELESAFAEIDETRAQAARLQEEHDEAIRAIDDVRLELESQIQSARDETFEVQTKLDQTLRQLDDLRDEARDEALRLNEELDDVRRQLDERNAEVRRLRDRLEEGTDEVKHSRPPPPGPASELDAARREAKWLRQQLIDAKRQLSKGAADAGKPRVPRPLGRVLGPDERGGKDESPFDKPAAGAGPVGEPSPEGDEGSPLPRAPRLPDMS